MFEPILHGLWYLESSKVPVLRPEEPAPSRGDEVVDAVEEGAPFFKVVGILGYLVEVAPLVFVQDEGTGTRLVLKDVFSLVQVNAI